METDGMTADQYTYSVAWSVMDQQYAGTCSEFPGLSHLDRRRPTALAGIHALVQDTIDAMEKAEEPLPTPFAPKRYSGKFMLRLPLALHQQLSGEAAAARISLNRLIVLKLTAAPSLTAAELEAAASNTPAARKNSAKAPAAAKQKLPA